MTSYHQVEPLLRTAKGIQLFIQRYPNFNSSEISYLSQAITCNHLYAIKALIQCGANLSLQNKYGYTPLATSCRFTSYHITKWILEQPMGYTTLNLQTLGNWTPLHIAAWIGKPETVALLLYHGANPVILNNNKETSSQIAKRMNNTQSQIILHHHEIMWKLNEWRPWKHKQYSEPYRKTIRTLVLIAKTTL